MRKQAPWHCIGTQYEHYTCIRIDDGVAAHDPNPPSLSDLVKTAELRWEMVGFKALCASKVEF